MSNADGRGPASPLPEYLFGGPFPVHYMMTCLECDMLVVTDPWYHDWVFYILEHIANNRHELVPWNLITD